MIVAVVLNWCSEEATRRCVASLRLQTGWGGVAGGAPPLEPLEILLVDNASPDGSGERLAAWVAGAAPAGAGAPPVHFLQTGANLGYAGGNAAGIRWAMERGAHWVLVVNPDVEMEQGALAAMRAVGEGAAVPGVGRSGGAGGRVAGVAPTVLDAEHPEHATYAGGTLDPARALGVGTQGPVERVAPRSAPPRPVSFLHGCCVLLRTEALAAVRGSFREDFFMYVEDAELSLRLSRAGWTLLHQPAARVRHGGDEAGDPPAWKIHLRDRNRRRLARAHFGAGGWLRFALWFYPTRGVHLLRYAMRGDGARVRAVLRGMVER